MRKQYGYYVEAPPCPKCSKEMDIHQMLVHNIWTYYLYCPDIDDPKSDHQYQREIGLSEWEDIFDGAQKAN